MNHLVVARYKNLNTHARMFARFKVACDCMFSELHDFTDPSEPIQTIIDIGSGYGIPAAWFLEKYPKAFVYGIEPDMERVRVASAALGNRAFIKHGAAPDIPDVPYPADLALILDMLHYLDDSKLKLTLERVHKKLKPDSRVIIRTAVPPENIGSWRWYFENLKLRIRKIPYDYRTIERMKRMLNDTGFEIGCIRKSGIKGESVWFVGVCNNNL